MNKNMSVVIKDNNSHGKNIVHPINSSVVAAVLRFGVLLFTTQLANPTVRRIIKLVNIC